MGTTAKQVIGGWTLIAALAFAACAPAEETTAPTTAASDSNASATDSQVSDTTAVPVSETASSAPESSTTTPATSAAEPPNVAQLEKVMEAVGADRLVWSPGSELTTLVIDRSSGTTTVQDLPVRLSWADHEFLYAWNENEEAMEVLDADGSVVCSLSRPADSDIYESLHHATRREDGSVVIAVLGHSDEGGPRPTFAQDCETGTRTPIEALALSGLDGEWTSIEQVAGQAFTISGDAEGNAWSIVNDRGFDVLAGGYAGIVQFSADGELLVFGDQRDALSPHVTSKLAAHDTNEGNLQWSVDLGQPIVGVQVADRHVVAELSSDSALFEGNWETERLLLLDRSTGASGASFDVEPGHLYYLG